MKEQTVFTHVFGDMPKVRLIDFFLCEGMYFDYSLTDIAKNSRISWRTLHQIMPRLIKLGIVKQTRQIGRAKLYMLNKENLLSKRLLELQFKLASDLADTIISKISKQELQRAVDA